MTGRPKAVRGRRAFRALVHSSRQARSGSVTVHFRPADEAADEIYVAYAVSRKVGGAVIRNHWRRRLRAIAAEAKVRPGMYLVAVNPSVRGTHFDELREQVIDTMRRASGEPS